MLPMLPTAQRINSIMYQCPTCNQSFLSHQLAEIHFASEEHLARSEGRLSSVQMINGPLDQNHGQTGLMQQQYNQPSYNQPTYAQVYEPDVYVASYQDSNATAYSTYITDNSHLYQNTAPSQPVQQQLYIQQPHQPQQQQPYRPVTHPLYQQPIYNNNTQPDYSQNYADTSVQYLNDMTRPTFNSPKMPFNANNNMNNVRQSQPQKKPILPYTPLDFTAKSQPNVNTNQYSAYGSINLNFAKNQPVKKKQKLDPSKVVARCEICSLDFNSTAQAEHHYKSTKHLRKIKNDQEILSTVGDIQKAYNEDADELTLNTIASRSKLFTCTICLCSLNSSVQYDQHIKGSAHQEKAQKLSKEFKEVPGQISGWFYCNPCDISCPTAVDLGKHVGMAEHKKKKAQTNAESSAATTS